MKNNRKIAGYVSDPVKDLLEQRAVREGLNGSTLVRRAVLAMLGVDADGKPAPAVTA
jgi:hypothetical protein